MAEHGDVWTCGKCGLPPSAHADPASPAHRCVYDPTLTPAPVEPFALWQEQTAAYEALQAKAQPR